MKKHAFAWQNLAFGAFFLAVAVNWIAHDQDVLTLDELSIAAPIALIGLGIIGIIATVWRKK